MVVMFLRAFGVVSFSGSAPPPTSLMYKALPSFGDVEGADQTWWVGTRPLDENCSSWSCPTSVRSVTATSAKTGVGSWVSAEEEHGGGAAREVSGSE